MCSHRILFHFIFLCFGSISSVVGQATLTAFPEITNFTNPERLTTEGVYDITQDARGLMYFGVDQGILEFDGSTWRHIPVPGIVRSVGFDGQHIYVGAPNSFGYLATDTLGRSNYIPLIDSLPEKERNYGGVWFVEANSREVVFNALYSLYVYRNDSLNRIQASGTIVHNSIQNDTLFARVANTGLVKLVGDSLYAVPGGEAVAKKALAAIIPSKKNQSASIEYPWFIIRRIDPPIIYDGQVIQETNFEKADALAEARPYKGVLLPNGHLALGTYLDGLYIYSREGKLLQHLTRENGLVGNAVQSMFLDRKENLWLGFRNGLSRLTFGAEVDYFDYRNGMDGRGHDLIRFQGHLYAANNKGVHKLGEDGQFRTVPYVKHLSWELLAVNDHLLSASVDGISWVNGPIKENLHRLVRTEQTFTMHRSQADSNRVIYSCPDFLGSIKFDPDQKTWREEGSFQKTKHLGVQLLEWPSNTLWVVRDSTLENYHLQIDSAKIKVNTRQVFGPREGLKGKIASGFILDEQLYFSGTAGIFRYDSLHQSFKFASEIPDTKTVHPNCTNIAQSVKTDTGVYAWVEPRKQVLLLQKHPNGSYFWKPISRSNTLATEGYRLRVDQQPGQKSNSLWLSTKDGWLRYYPKAITKEASFQAFIREVRLTPNSIIYHGNGLVVNQAALDPKTAALRFTYASPVFQNQEKIRYQYWLQGFEADWSTPTLETSKDYTNLKPGNYTFHIRAIDLDDNLSETDAYTFTIITPWYLRWWAYLVYAVLFAGLLAGLTLLRVWYLEQKNRALEATIKDRTEQLRQQTERLRESEKVKTRFFANISHEFRTPLTVIGGMVNQIRNKGVDKLEHNLELIERNSFTLLRLINQLLDLTKLESSQMKLYPVQDNIIGYLDYIVESFYSLAESRDIELESIHELESYYMDYDPSKLLQILSNLLSNALKFTPPGGKVSVSTEVIQKKYPAGLEKWLLIHVKDTGIGITKDKQAYIFNHFYQVDNSSTRKGEGTGIGLTLVKELVELAGGRIDLESQLDQGTTFTVQLPISQQAEKAPQVPRKAEAFLEQNQLFLSSSNVEIETLKQQEIDQNLPLLLIIEDNPDVVIYLRACLENQYKIRVASNGKMGIELALALIPDIIISDVMMPLKNGFEVCETLKNDEKTSHIPIILLTAKNTSDSRITGLQGGADAYLSKPFDERELLVRLKTLVALRRTLRMRYTKLEVPLGIETKDASNKEDTFIIKVRRLINEHLDDSQYGIDEVCHDLAMSRMQLHRKLKALTNQSTTIFIRNVRLQIAHELLNTTDKNVSEIAYEVGFNDPKYFSRVFVERYGRPPSSLK